MVARPRVAGIPPTTYRAAVVSERKRVVVVGGGFGGLTLTKALRNAAVDVTIVDRENHHLFQPLLYQVATASLSPGDIAEPIRSVIHQQRNVRTILGEVHDVDFGAREVSLSDGARLPYDYLVIAAGAKTTYYGHPEWERYAYGLKNLREALRIRERILMLFEAAEREPDPARRRELLSFFVIGGGPTGVEMAGAISELGRRSLRRDFRVVRPEEVRVVLVEMAERVLTPFDERLSSSAARQLEELDVELQLGRRVTNVGPGWLEIDGESNQAGLVVWASGVEPVSLAGRLDVPHERGRLVVQPDCSLPAHPDVFAIGDISWFVPDGESDPLPGVSPVAMQQGRHVAAQIRRLANGQETRPFRYVDKGMMATIGRSRAVAESGTMRLTGLLAWLSWLFVHLFYLIGFRNRLIVLTHWFWQYITFKRGTRLVAQQKGWAANELADLLRDGEEPKLPSSSPGRVASA